MSGRGRRISDWKGIAAYFGRDQRTVRRWERQRGLPVHRIAGGARSLVYAYEGELEQWLRSVGSAVSGPLPENSPAEAGPSPEPVPASAAGAAPAAIVRARAGRLRWGAGAVLAAAVATVVIVLARGGFLPRDAEAHDRYRPAPEIEELYVDAVYQLATRQQAGFERAIAGLTEATRRDPKFAAAFASLAEAYNTVSQFTPMPADQAYPLAEAAARQAIALDPDMAQAYAALAFTQFYWDRDFDRSRELFERAIALDPGSAQTRHWFALTRMMTGDFGVALREIAAAQRINPESRVIQANRALIRFHAGEVEQALTTLRLLADSEPKLRSPPEYLATIYLDRHDMPMFLREYRIAAGISGDEARSRIADAAEAGLRDGGEQGMLRAMFEAQQRRHAEAHEPAYKLAATAALLGETDTALSYLDEALAAREQDMLGVLIDPAFRSLRDDERYRRIVEAVGFHVSDKPVRAF